MPLLSAATISYAAGLAFGLGGVSLWLAAFVAACGVAMVIAQRARNGALLIVLATGMLVGNSARFASRSIQPSATPLVWPQLILPAGYGLLCLAYVEEIARRLRGLPPRRDDAEIDVSLS